MDNWTENQMKLGTTSASPTIDKLTTTIWTITLQQKRDQVELACYIAFSFLLFLLIIVAHAAITHIKAMNR